MGCCLAVLVGAIWPRLTLILLWLFDPKYFTTAFQTWIFPLLGFIFLPTTTLAYELVKNWSPGGRVDGYWLILLALGLLHDLGHIGLGVRSTRA